MAAVTLRAFAKINLSLRISTARSDGFHDVRTILQAVDLFDRVKCEPRRGPFHIRCNMPGVPTDRTNLVWKGAQLLWRAGGRTGEPKDARITLQKTIPMEAGLGGGSSNAAAALLGLRRMWRLHVADEQIYVLAAKLGSDVPFFLTGGTALGLGRGDEIYPLADLPAYWAVLVLPPFGVATKDAYGWFDEDAGTGDVSYLPETWLGRTTPLVNDLESPVIARHPVIGQLKRRLLQRGALMAAMSGSGSTVFGVFKSAVVARGVARTLSTAGARVITTRFLRRAKP